MKNHSAIGRLFFAIAMIASGILQVIRQDFVRLVPKTAMLIPWPHAWATASGAVLVVLGLAIITQRKSRLASLGLAGLFFAVLMLYLPEIVSNPGALFVWGNPCKTLALLSGALLLAGMSPPTNISVAGLTLARARLLCAVCLGVFLVLCGIMHFVYLDFVVQMVPAWMPGRSFWAYFTGMALLAGGVGINFPLTARVAALLTGLMIFIWVVMLHLPLAFASWPEAGETAAIFEALALSGMPLLLAASARTIEPIEAEKSLPAKGQGGPKPGSSFLGR